MKRPLTTLAEEIEQHLRIVRQLLRQPVEAEFARGGLTGPQRSVIHHVVHFGALSLKELSKHVGLSHSTVSGIVDRLEKRGLLERQVDSKDRRITRVIASKRVRNYMRTTLPVIKLSPLLRSLQPSTQAERAKIADGLRTLRRLVETALLPKP